MADPRDHDAPIWAITIGGIRTSGHATIETDGDAPDHVEFVK